MTNTKEKRYCAGERSKLKEILPIEFPLSLTVEASSACNFKCNYCSNSVEKNTTKAKNLNYETYVKLIDDLKESGYKIKALNLSRIGEPLLNKHLPEMIAYAKQSEVFGKILLITNGALLNPTLNQQIVDAGLDSMLISVQGVDAQKYLDVSKVKIDFDKFVENIAHFYSIKGNCRLHIKVFHEALDGKIDEFYKIFEDICDELSIEHVVPYMQDVDYKKIDCEFEKNRYGDNITKHDICPQAFFTLSVLSDGNVGVCCINNHDSFIMGNINDNTILEIWNSKKLKEFRKMQINGNRYKHPVCGKCEFPIYGMQESDNLEDISEELRNYYLNDI